MQAASPVVFWAKHRRRPEIDSHEGRRPLDDRGAKPLANATASALNSCGLCVTQSNALESRRRKNPVLRPAKAVVHQLGLCTEFPFSRWMITVFS
jgi:hypothetical protein